MKKPHQFCVTTTTNRLNFTGLPIKGLCLSAIFTVILLAFSGIAMAQTVNLTDFGAIPDDNIDDAPALLSAFNAIKSKGGTIRVSGGTFLMASYVPMITDGSNNISVTIEGDGSAAFRLAGSFNNLEGGNLYSFKLKNLIFLGNGTSSRDAGYVVYSSYVQYTTIDECQFMGLLVSGAVIYSGNTDMTITNSSFAGNASPTNVMAQGWRGLTVKNTTFIDYGVYQGVFYSQTPRGNANWIKVIDPQEFNAIGQKRINIADSRFDEGASTAISITNAGYVDISGININVSGTTPGVGIVFDNVFRANVSSSWFGYTNQNRPAISYLNGSNGSLDGIECTQGVNRILKTAQSNVKGKFLRGCSIVNN